MKAHSSNPTSQKKKNGYNRGDEKFLLEMGGKPGMGFIIGKWETFKVSVHSWQRGANPLILWRPPYIAYPPIFKCCPASHPQLPCHFQPPPSLSFLLSCFFSWMGDHTTFDVLFYLRMISIYTCQALVP